MVAMRSKSLRLLIIMAIMLLFFTASAFCQYNNTRLINRSNAYSQLQTVSTRLTSTLQSVTSISEWNTHSPAFIALLKNNLDNATQQISQYNMTINKLGFVSFLFPSWSLSLILSHNQHFHHYFFANNESHVLSTISKLQNSYFKYFIPIILQNKVVGDFYLVAYQPHVTSLFWVENNLPFYIDIAFIVLIIYFIFSYLNLFSMKEHALSFLTLADTMPAIKKHHQHVASKTSIRNDSNRPTLEVLIQDIINRASTAVIHFDLGGTILFFNPFAAERIGITKSDHITSVNDLIKSLHVSRDKAKLLINELMSNGFLYNQLIEFRNHQTHENRVALVSVIEFSSNSQLAGYLLFAEDITEMGAYNINNIPYVDRLNLIAEFAASTAHEIRNPLTTVRGFLQLQMKHETNKRNESHYRVMIEEIDRVDQLISEYLRLARNSSMNLKEEISISNLVISLIPLITAEANLKQVEVFVQHLPIGICYANANELKQVFLNICKNSLDSMDNGGSLFIEGSEEQTNFTIKIRDTGIGMSKEVMEHIFDPFYTTKENGSGIGLSVSMKIIKSHQGSIMVDSAVGAGTTFSITLPMIERQHMPPIQA